MESIRGITFEIKYPSIHKYYNCLYSIDNRKIYYGCHKKCKVCKDWNTKSQIWKSSVFFPIHCHLCNFAGNTEDFSKDNIFIVCLNCKKNIKSKKKNLFH